MTTKQAPSNNGHVAPKLASTDLADTLRRVIAPACPTKKQVVDFVDEQIGALRAEVQAGFEAAHENMKEGVLTALKAVKHVQHEKEVNFVSREEYIDLQTRFEKLQAYVGKRLHDMEETYTGAVNNLEAMLRAMPVPVVNVAPPRLVKKQFTYDNFGRPDTVEEREVDKSVLDTPTAVAAD